MSRVLIAEDEKMIRKGLAYITDWSSMDCVVVVEAANDQDGCEKILEYRLDMVITDIYTPFMDGIEVIKKASEQVRFRSIFLISYADFEYARRAIETRVCKYLLEPMDEEALVSIIGRLGEEIMNSHQMEHMIEQAGIGGGNLNLEYYIQLNLSENQYISRAITVIRGDFVRELSIKSIPDDLGISASYLSRKFEEVTGQTFPDFLGRCRVQQAIVMLGTRQYRISETSRTTKFMDYEHFCSVFKKYTPKSPTKFIKGVSRGFVRNPTIAPTDEIVLTLERLHGLRWICQK